MVELGDALFDAVVEVMARWKEDWPERPSAVVSIGSNRRPKLITSMARRLADIGRLPYLGEILHDGPSADTASNSAHRFRSVWGAYTLAPGTEASLPDHKGKAVLLVDDCLDTGWTMTVVARQLRQQGAGRVYPLVLAVGCCGLTTATEGVQHEPWGGFSPSSGMTSWRAERGSDRALIVVPRRP